MSTGPRMPIPVELDLAALDESTREFHVTLRFGDRSRLTVDFPSETDEYQRLLQVFGEVATRTLNTLGNKGIVVGTTEPEQDDEGEDS